MNKRQAVPIGIGLAILVWLAWPYLSPYVMELFAPRGSQVITTYYRFPTERVIAAVVVATLTFLAAYFLHTPVLSPGEIKADDHTEEGVWPPPPRRG